MKAFSFFYCGAYRVSSGLVFSALLALFAPLAHWAPALQAQVSGLTIALVSDAAGPGEPGLDSLITTELEALLASRYDLEIIPLYAGGSDGVAETLRRAYGVGDVVISSGIAGSTALLARGVYSKPTIAAAVLAAPDFGGTEGTGIDNLTFVRSPFDLRRDLETLAELQPYTTLTVLTTEELRPTLATLLPTYTPAKFDFVGVAGRTVDRILADLDPASEAVYLTPLDGRLSVQTQRQLLDSLSARGLATFALIDRPLLDLGALAAYSSAENLEKLPRRVALDVLRIMDGLPAAGLSTEIASYSGTLVINMAAARRANIYPGWAQMRSAIILNPNELARGRELTFEGAILEGLSRNLGYKIGEYDVQLAATDAAIAKSALLPQLEVASTVTMLDGQAVASSFGQQGKYNWTANASASQVILSEPAFANAAIQRLLLEGQQAQLETTQLDVVLDVSVAYLNVLQARAFARLQHENQNVSRTNYNLALNKRELGATGATDVYRWESELALGAINVNDAEAQLAQARYNLNQLLDRPANDAFQLPEFLGQDTLLRLIGETLLPVLENSRDIDRLADFLAEEARRNLPTLRQLDLAIAAQERQQLASRRALYLPQVAVQGQYNYRVANYGTEPLPPDLGFDFAAADRPRGGYNVALNVSLPIFQGGKRKFQLEQARVSALQAATQRRNTENQLLQRLYSDVELVVASYRNLNLSREAAQTSERNFVIIDDLYRAGATNVTSVVDAQNVVLQSRINATNAGYQFVADFLSLQRSTGSYQFLEGEAAQTAFMQRFVEFKSK